MEAKFGLKSFWNRSAAVFMIALILCAVLPVMPVSAGAKIAAASGFVLDELIPTTTTVTTSGSPSTYESTVTFTATVSPSEATGTVEFYDGAILLGTSTLSTGTATFDIGTLDVAGSPHSITPKYLGDTIYASSTSSETSQSINAKPITVTADPGQTKVFGETDPTFTFISSDPAAPITGELGRVAGEDVGAYAIGQNTLSAGSNYNITFVPADFTITPKPVTVTADSGQTKVFGAANPTYTYTSSDPAATFSGALSRVAGENVGTYAITQGSLLGIGNYTITSFIPANFSITVKTLTVTADSKSKNFGAPDPVFTFVATGFVGSDGFTTSPTCSVPGAHEAVGQYDIVCSGGNAGTNYNIVYDAPAPGKLTVKEILPFKATLTSPTGAIGTNFNPTYLWNKVSNATYYYLYVTGPSGNLIAQWYPASTVCSGATCSVTPATILDIGAHTWWILTWNSVGYGPYSNGMIFSTSMPSNPPGVATLSTPSGNIGTNYNPTYTWNKVAGSTLYYLYVNGPGGNIIHQWYTSTQADCTGTTCSVTPSKTLTGGAHTWWIQTWNPAGYGPWSSEKTFSTVPLGAATLVSPAGNISTNYTPNFVWNEVPGSTDYYLYVSGPSGKVLDQWYQASSICNAGTCTVVTPVSLGGGDHTWWVQTYNPAGVGPWSTGLAFSTTIPTPPAAATLVSPTGNIGTNYNPNFIWNAVGNATWYELHISGPSGKVLDQWYQASAICSAGTCTVTNPLTLAGGNHTWWVLTNNSAGNGDWSPGKDFNTFVETPPLPVTSFTFPLGSITTNYTPDYTWGAIGNATWYELYVSGPSGKVLDAWFEASVYCNAGTCTVPHPVTLAGGNHTWWVRTWNSAGYGIWSAGQNFNTTIPTPPATATLVSPTGSGGANPPTYTWNKVTGSTWYYVWVNGPPGNVLKQWYDASLICGASTCSVTQPSSLANGSYTWWVQTWNPAGYGLWSSNLNFSIP